MTATMILQNDVRIGIQVIVEGERLEVQELLTLIALFLKYAIPCLITLDTLAGIAMTIIGGIQDTFLAMPRINLTPIGGRDFLTIYIGLCLISILIGTMITVYLKNTSF